MLRIGVAQIRNSFNYATNLKYIQSALQTYAQNGADLVFFPECAVTGFNTGMRQLDEGGIRSSVQAVQNSARALKLTVALPTPWPRGDGKFLNSVLLIDESGEIVRRFDKIGFQRGEDKIFVPGEPHARCFELNGTRVGVIICIESTHDAWSFLRREDSPDVILWPGFYGPIPGTSWSDDLTDASHKVRLNLAQWNVPILQATCADSPEAQNWPDRVFGGSPVVAASGREYYSARPEVEDLLLVEIEGKTLVSARSLVFESYWRSAAAVKVHASSSL